MERVNRSIDNQFMSKTNMKPMPKLSRGQGMTEYIIIVALIAIAAIGVITVFGDNIRALFGMATDAVAGDTQMEKRTSKSQVSSLPFWHSCRLQTLCRSPTRASGSNQRRHSLQGRFRRDVAISAPAHVAPEIGGLFLASRPGLLLESASGGGGRK